MSRPAAPERRWRPTLRILGTRGLPARYGGFETFAESLARHLVQKGWEVTVYCQEPVGTHARESQWEGIRLVHVPMRVPGGFGALLYDLDAIRHTMRRPGLCLVLGYNTAVFGLLLKLKRIPQVMNMDGLEWKRPKWSWPVRCWLYLNERAGSLLAEHLVADHPEMETHLRTRTRASRITMIPYGADRVTEADPTVAARYGLEPGRYAVIVAGSVPDNSILETVRAFSRKARPVRLAVVGRYRPETNGYHCAVRAAASPDVVFPGPIYDPDIRSIRFHARLYVHGHTVGGTNPSLVESMAAGQPVLARDNPYNRWVAGDGAAYFRDEPDCARLFDELLDDDAWLAKLRRASVARHEQLFTQEAVLGRYESLLLAWQPSEAPETRAILERRSEQA